ncbi:MAG: hypothetical protein JXR07_01115 [Reichenbachiella sp.]
MSDHHFTGGTRLGTISGTVLSITANINSADLIKTCMLAAIGATVSFLVSVFWRWLMRTAKN